ncbi:unnamed protein product [Rotaria sp. Silwood2]|nr:unnamed protein product [Rotaria sp. Silwood2]CAF3081536.1 unnamed protein product [Rotaria sp. Silwood2]CAF3320263.1 unnamed protein product [Rotaria sp. Silwood2]CAF3365443.1 unnamed protein product [Rotaria sp. Silwood2]CAF4446208.1 unnamed protein product [Rotaria sp. Silwood2]
MSYSSNCLSLSSSLASQFSQSIVFSPRSDDISSHITRHIYISNQPTLFNSPTTNIILSLTSNQNLFDFYHHQQPRHDQQTIDATSTHSSTLNTPTSTYVLCR